MSNAQSQSMSFTLHEARDFIANHIRYMCDRKQPGEPIMLTSSPGVGKSAIVNHDLKDMIGDTMEKAFGGKFRVWLWSVGNMPETDILGLPFVSTVDVDDRGIEKKDMSFSTPPNFPEEDECGILFVDELPNGSVGQQQACYRLLHERTVHNGKKLPPGVIVIGAGNFKTDKTGSRGLIPAVARRFAAHLTVMPSVEEFVSYCYKKNLDPMIPAYINFAGREALQSTAITGEYGFACPANWESVSGHKLNPYHTAAHMENAVISCLGSKAGTDFVGFCRNEKYLPNFDKIRETGEYTPPENHNVDRGVMFTVINACAGNIVRWFTDENATEEQVTLVDTVGHVLKHFDASTKGVAFRALRRADPKITRALLVKRDRFPILSAQFAEVLERTSAMNAE